MKTITPAFILLVCSISFACNSNSNVVKEQSYEDSLQSLLIGFWGNPNEDTPVWKMDKDSIYYLQRHETYSYKLQGNDVLINNPEYPMWFKNISFIEDTLYFHDADGGGILKACRKK